MRSSLCAAALMVTCMFLTGCCSMNGVGICDSGCGVVGGSCVGGGCDAGTVGQFGDCGPCRDAHFKFTGLASGHGGHAHAGCASGQCQVGRSMFSPGLFSRGISMPALPPISLPSFPAIGSAVGSCSTNSCGCDGGPVGGLGLAGCASGDCGNGAGGFGFGDGAACGCGDGSCGCNFQASGKIAQRVSAALPFPGLRGINHPYGKKIPHTANMSTGMQFPGGGQAPSYAYPYYTTRGPRDFLMDNPPSIGR